jgi:hypothetical protein
MSGVLLSHLYRVGGSAAKELQEPEPIVAAVQVSPFCFHHHATTALGAAGSKGCCWTWAAAAVTSWLLLLVLLLLLHAAAAINTYGC